MNYLSVYESRHSCDSLEAEGKDCYPSFLLEEKMGLKTCALDCDSNLTR